MNGEDYWTWDFEAGSCLLCGVVSGSPASLSRQMLRQYPGVTERILETRNFIVIADAGPIVEGYTLIISKRCVPSMGCLSEEELSELGELKEVMRQCIRETYCEPVMFEHGEGSAKKLSSSCIAHAHLHVVPTSANLISGEVDLKFRRVDSLLLDLPPTPEGYLFYETQAGVQYLAMDDGCLRQYFRRRLQRIVARDRSWNWWDYVKYPDLLNTTSFILSAVDKLATRITAAWGERLVERRA